MGGSLTVTNSSGGGSKDNRNDKGGGTNNEGGRKNAGNTAIMIGRRHKASRRRSGETRLRESQSLNRISEVQEDNTHTLVISTTVVATTPKVKGIGARILQGLSMSARKHSQEESGKSSQHVSRKDTVKSLEPEAPKLAPGDKKKLRILGKYFQVSAFLFTREKK